MKRYGKIIKVIFAFIIILLLLYLGNNWLQVTHCQVNVKGLPQSFAGFRIVLLSDLHAKEFGRENKRLAAVIDREKPDLIIAAGDLINSTADDGSAFLNLLKGLDGKYPVYFSLGNHEQIVRERDREQNTRVYQEFVKQVQEAGGVVLDNQQAEIKRGRESIALYGFTSMLYHYLPERAAAAQLKSGLTSVLAHYSGRNTAYWEGSELKADFIEKKLGRAPDGQTTILLAHNPKYLAEYADWGADLVLAGHIHGGMIRLPFIGGVFSPDISLFPTYQAGLYREGNTALYVSRGLGLSVIPFRVFNPPEVAVLTLLPE